MDNKEDKKKNKKPIKIIAIIIAVLIALYLILLMICSYGEFSGIVIDAETGKPVEGAVIAANWSVTKGVPGLSYSTPYMATEDVTDKEGRFSIAGPKKVFVQKPEIVVFKRAYVAWRNDWIFPNWDKREDFKYKTRTVIKLEIFKDSYSFSDHAMFMGHGMQGAGSSITPNFTESLREERSKARREVEDKKDAVSKNKLGGLHVQ